MPHQDAAGEPTGVLSWDPADRNACLTHETSAFTVGARVVGEPCYCRFSRQ